MEVRGGRDRERNGCWCRGLTCDDDQRCETGEGGNVQFHPVQGLRELQDGVDPVAEAPDALHFVQHGAIAEDELLRFRVGS